MTRLHSITLGNTRRFADNVRIDFGPGATILLAPNGTGKTTVFEAIELALTGTIARLTGFSENLAPFVREGQSQSFVQLDFGEGLTRTTKLDRLTPPVISGNLGNLLGEVESKDISYLLRLTHLLDQHDRHWFVEANSDDAGNRLSSLPIGKDGVRASGVITSTKKALTEKRKDAERRYTEAEDKLTKWKSLVTARDHSTVDLGRPLIALPELTMRLKSLAVSVDTEVQDKGTLAALMDSLAEIISLTEQQFESLQVRTGALAKCDSLLAEFLNARQILDQAQLMFARLQTTKQELEERLTKAQTALVENDLSLQSQQNSRRKLDELQQRVVAMANAKMQETAKQESLNQATQTVTTAVQGLLDATTTHRAAQQAAELHDQLRSRSESLMRSEKELATAGVALTRWSEHLGEIGKLDEIIKGLGSEIEKLTVKHQVAADNLKNCQNAADLAQRAFDGVNQAAGAVREAVSTIALQLPKDRADCPLCGYMHGATELQRRMSNALQIMDPALGPASEGVEQSRSLVEEAYKLFESLKYALMEAQAELAKLEIRKAEIVTEVEGIRIQPIFIGSDVSSARTVITTREAELEVMRSNFVSDQSSAPVETKPEELEEFKRLMHIAESTLESAKIKHGEANTALSLAQDHCRAAEEAMGEATVGNDLAPQLVAINTVIAQAMAAVEESRAERDRRRVAFDEACAEVQRGDDMVNIANERMQDLRTRWSGIPLKGEPNAEDLTSAKQQLLDGQNKIETSRKELQTIRTELARWEAAETFHHAQREMAAFRGERSDEAFMTHLELELTIAEAEVNRVSKGTSALDTFSAILKKECDEANQRVGDVVPLWKTLLNRVVREPRFAETTLEVSNRYNKQHAKTMVSLHGRQTEVLAVASEAQMTDLQLTFLLAMAQQYPWSPWKALLLDDPTQHHDLVHASAVFDLLRDYIADYGFQVVIATHDALQARFFMRKLENDGIQSRLWSLKPTDEGVNAFLEC